MNASTTRALGVRQFMPSPPTQKPFKYECTKPALFGASFFRTPFSRIFSGEQTILFQSLHLHSPTLFPLPSPHRVCKMALCPVVSPPPVGFFMGPLLQNQVLILWFNLLNLGQFFSFIHSLYDFYSVGFPIFVSSLQSSFHRILPHFPFSSLTTPTPSPTSSVKSHTTLPKQHPSFSPFLLAPAAQVFIAARYLYWKEANSHT